MRYPHTKCTLKITGSRVLADIFTKFLDYPKFKAILDKIINFAS